MLFPTDTSYMVRGHDFHNAFVVRTGKESWYGWNKRRITLNEKMAVAVEDFQHAGPLGCARLRVSNYILYPLTVQREYMFLGKAGLWVRDTVEATKPFEANYGPAWQTTAVYGPTGRRRISSPICKGESAPGRAALLSPAGTGGSLAVSSRNAR